MRLATAKPIVARQATNNGAIDVPSVLFDVVTVTRDNIVTTVVADGQVSYDDVYRGIPEAARPPRP
jgi:D-xylose transport system substrate-binding protein